MNLTLAAVAFLIVLFGAAVGFYPISVLGLFILIAALLVPSRPSAPKPQPAPQGTSGTPARITPKAPPPPAYPPTPQMAPPMAPQAMPQYSTMTMFPQGPREGYTPTMPLFPSTMFPSMFPSMSPVPMVPAPQEQKPPSEKTEPVNDLVEMAAIIVLLKMLSG